MTNDDDKSIVKREYGAERKLHIKTNKNMKKKTKFNENSAHFSTIHLHLYMDTIC